eukprot:CAMPEP_0194391208 /NCGR_PEP_ID=MMETSP0174-20130528/114367_1 /TAXON_ID=216777 /ORGANISM="Proboscia alata, Strain PI-D3" /LENGTH=90 /DNA_ID=CAMNT_0039185313 /DNA_START=139 /DNA_END=407 /DNA_ORIENTATION=+
MASSKEEIARQHGEAMDIIQSPATYGAAINMGEIPLSWKQIPTKSDPLYTSKGAEEGSEEKKEDAGVAVDGEPRRGVVSSRGTVDVSDLA